nr:unnamed protein product [Callosobruchus analis]
MARLLLDLGCLVTGVVAGLLTGRYGKYVLSQFYTADDFERIDWQKECEEDECDCGDEDECKCTPDDSDF